MTASAKTTRGQTRQPADAPAPARTRSSPAERISPWLASVARPGAWRAAGAFAAVWLSVAATVGGLFHYATQVQAGLLGGVCAALIAPSRRASATAAVAATFVGVGLGPASWWSAGRASSTRLMDAGEAALIAGVVALVIATAIKRTPRICRPLEWALIGLLVANMWASSIYGGSQLRTIRNGDAHVSLFQILAAPPAAAVTGAGDTGDQYSYLRVLSVVKGGGSFYRAWHDELGPNRQAGESAGNSVVNYNLPTRFWFWAALPGTPVSIVYAYLLLVSMAVAAVPLMVRGSVRLPLAVPGAAAVAAYLGMFGSVLFILSGEVWSGALGLMAIAAWARSEDSDRWRAWTVAAVALGLLAALFREPAALVPVAGLIAALAVRDGQRRFRATAWAVGLMVLAALYLAHYLSVRPFLAGSRVGAVFGFSGVDTIVSALTWGGIGLGTSKVLPLALACLGLAGAWFFHHRRTALFALLLAALSMLSYMVVNNGASDLASGAPVNYWGVAIVPMIYACVPVVFAVVPTMSSPRRPAGGSRAPGAPGPADAGRSR